MTDPFADTLTDFTGAFAGRVAFVTGASAGMGVATARAFATAGASVALADLDLDAARAEADRLNAESLQAIAVGCDVSDEDQVAAAVEHTVATFGRLAAAYNNAGIQAPVGLVGLPGRAAYHAGKHGVIGLTRSAALEYAPRGIRINAVCPAASFITCVALPVDGGYTAR